MNIRFLAPAQRELDDAVEWYNRQAVGLGQELLDELDRAARRAVAFPMSYPEIEPGIRRAEWRDSPYGVIYGLGDKTLLVLTVARLHRRPRYWIERI